MTRSLSVWWAGAIAGTLRVNQHGEMSFVYAPEWLADSSRPAVSFSLPKREEPFKRRECRQFFAGLLPEEAQRDAVAGALGLSERNDFGLLEALGGDVAGALTLWPEGETPPAGDPSAKPQALADDDLVALLDTLPTRPLLAGREGLRLSLAGAQSKLPVVLVDDRIALPAPGQPTTHILKPPIARFFATTENEALVMKLAAALGLPVAPVDVRTTHDRSYLLITRYDRRFDEAGRAHRLHQEDFCQALGIPPENKYAAEGGPTFRTSFDLLRRSTTRPAVATLVLLDAAIFNLIVGNADAHGKNFSLLYDSGTTSLAPLYDLLSTIAYPDLSPKLAMKIAKRAIVEELDRASWDAFAADIGMAAPFVRRRVKELAATTQATVAGVSTAISGANLDGKALETYAATIVARAERVLKTV
jgi:serine/threonine-protein kinase HipA